MSFVRDMTQRQIDIIHVKINHVATKKASKRQFLIIYAIEKKTKINYFSINSFLLIQFARKNIVNFTLFYTAHMRNR